LGSWKLIHEYEGEPEAERTHVYFRLVMEALSGSNYVGGGDNFTEAKGDSCNPVTLPPVKSQVFNLGFKNWWK
jgi:hypothetical protein